MIIHELDAIWARFGPDETQAPSVVGADAELARPVAFEGFKGLPGGERSGSSVGAASSMSSFRATILAMARHWVGQSPSLKNRSVSESAKPMITRGDICYVSHNVERRPALAFTGCARPAAARHGRAAPRRLRRFAPK